MGGAPFGVADPSDLIDPKILATVSRYSFQVTPGKLETPVMAPQPRDQRTANWTLSLKISYRVILGSITQ